MKPIPISAADATWKLSWGYFNTKLKDAWAVWRRKAVALYV